MNNLFSLPLYRQPVPAIFVLLEIEKNVKFGKKIDYGNSRKLTYKFYRIRVRQYKSFQLIDSVNLK